MKTAEDTVLTELKIEIELWVNQRLYEGGYITVEMYEKAKNIILKGASRI